MSFFFNDIFFICHCYSVSVAGFHFQFCVAVVETGARREKQTSHACGLGDSGDLVEASDVRSVCGHVGGFGADLVSMHVCESHALCLFPQTLPLPSPPTSKQ